MNNTRKEIHIERRFGSRDFALHLLQFDNNTGVPMVGVAQDMRLLTITPEIEGMEHPPLMHLSADECQQFMDELWRAGIRPTEGAGSVGQLGAVQRHLEDMRSLVFKTPALALP